MSWLFGFVRLVGGFLLRCLRLALFAILAVAALTFLVALWLFSFADRALRGIWRAWKA